MDVELVAQIRNESGKGVARRLRRMDMVPAIFYGPKSETLPLRLPTVRLEKLLREMGEEHKLLRLTIEGGSNQAGKTGHDSRNPGASGKAAIAPCGLL